MGGYITQRSVQSFFCQSGNAINKNFYNDILKEKLVPFIKKNYSPGDYVFWPDLVSAHYAALVTIYLKNQKIPYIPKFMISANLPKALPKKDLWANLKKEVYKGNWRANNHTELENRIRRCLGNMDLKVVQDHALPVRKRLNHTRRHDG